MMRYLIVLSLLGCGGVMNAAHKLQVSSCEDGDVETCEALGAEGEEIQARAAEADARRTADRLRRECAEHGHRQACQRLGDEGAALLEQHARAKEADIARRMGDGSPLRTRCMQDDAQACLAAAQAVTPADAVLAPVLYWRACELGLPAACARIDDSFWREPRREARLAAALDACRRRPNICAALANEVAGAVDVHAELCWIGCEAGAADACDEIPAPIDVRLAAACEAHPAVCRVAGDKVAITFERRLDLYQRGCAHGDPWACQQAAERTPRTPENEPAIRAAYVTACRATAAARSPYPREPCASYGRFIAGLAPEPVN